MEEPLIQKNVLLEKFPGKGGWTYARLPEIKPGTGTPFGWKIVKGRIDHVEIRQYHLMPMGNGQLFLPVKAAIRKQIKKEAGDLVEVVLYADNAPADIPEEFMLCLRDEPLALVKFQQLNEAEQMKYIRWIYAVKSEDLKVERIAEAIKLISAGNRL